MRVASRCFVAEVTDPSSLARHRGEHRERVHLYYDDGSMVTLEHSAPEAERLLALARAAL